MDAAPETVEEAAPVDVEPVAAAVLERFEGSVAVESRGQSVVYVPRDAWRDAVAYLRTEERFTQCSDVTAVDHLRDAERLAIPGVAPERFEVVANFLSHPRNRRIRLVAQVPADDARIASITPEYPGAGFPEREVYDLLGIVFDGHPDLTRILMPDDWEGHPLRKDDVDARIPVTFKSDPGPR